MPSTTDSTQIQLPISPQTGPPGGCPGGAEGDRLLVPPRKVGPDLRRRPADGAGRVLVRGDRQGGDADVHAAREELLNLSLKREI